MTVLASQRSERELNGNQPGKSTMDRLIRNCLVAPTLIAFGTGLSGCSGDGGKPLTHHGEYRVERASAIEAVEPRALPASILSQFARDTSVLVENPHLPRSAPLDRETTRLSSLPVRLPRITAQESGAGSPSIPQRLPMVSGPPSSDVVEADQERRLPIAGSGLQPPAQRLADDLVEMKSPPPPRESKPIRLPPFNEPVLPKSPPWEERQQKGPSSIDDLDPVLVPEMTAPKTADVFDQRRESEIAESEPADDSLVATDTDGKFPPAETEMSFQRLPAPKDESIDPPSPQVVSNREAAAFPVPASSPEVSASSEAQGSQQDPVVQEDIRSSVPRWSTMSDIPANREPNIAQPIPVPTHETVLPAQRLNPAVAERAIGVARKGMSLTLRGALFSARTEFIQALRLVGQGLDAQTGGMEKSQALANGLRALDEAESFLPRGARLEADVDLGTLIQSHRTPVLKDSDTARLTPLAAMQHYYRYAQEQLSIASASEPAASLALFGLGKIETVMSNESPQASRSSVARAMTYHQAALHVDRANFPAANELGVLLARCGQWAEARDVLQLSVRTHPLPETWHNLATVHDRLGETDFAQQARQQQIACSSQSAQRGFGVGGSSETLVQWLSVREFVQESGTQGVDPVASNAPSTPPPRAAATPSNSKPSPWKILPR